MICTRGETIGRGSTAVVSLATCCFSGETFAVKSSDVHRSEPLQNEAQVLSTLDSLHIVGYRGCDVTREKDGLVFNLFLEYLPAGSLSDAIRKRGLLEEAVIAQYARQITIGLGYLHSQGIVHCDVKPSNILIGHGNCAKIADFGCAKRMDTAPAAIGGTPMYMAPEVARGLEQGCPADVWGLGCTVLEMATGKFPWGGVCDPVSVVHKIVYSGESPEVPSHLSQHGKDFLEKCLRRNPNERWTVGQLLAHPFIDHRVNCGINFKQAEEFSLSPTSVMDQEFWDSAEVSCQATAPSTSNCESTQGRIGKLCCGDELLPIWSNDEGWIDVRGGEEEESRCSGSEVTSTVGNWFKERQEQSGCQKSLVESVGKSSGYVNGFDLLCFCADKRDSIQSIHYFL